MASHKKDKNVTSVDLVLIYGLTVGGKDSLGRSGIFKQFAASCRHPDSGYGWLHRSINCKTVSVQRRVVLRVGYLSSLR